MAPLFTLSKVMAGSYRGGGLVKREFLASSPSSPRFGNDRGGSGGTTASVEHGTVELSLAAA
jgi:hypothetical protein